jgi:uncharacterized protein
MLVLDTNVLVYAANKDSELNAVCRRRIEECRAGSLPWYLSWPICYEFLRICTHPNILPHPWSIPAGWNFLESILAAPSAGLLLPTARHAEVLGEVIAEVPHLRGNILHDVDTAVLMREHGIKQIYTLDTDFHRFRFLTVLDPA